jgi:hypothetical protein
MGSSAVHVVLVLGLLAGVAAAIYGYPASMRASVQH